MSDVKLPRQWKHWCKKVGIRPECRGSDTKPKWAWFSLRGLGRRWRINCHNQLSVSYKEEYFDRWALSLVEDAPMPTTEAEFLATVKRLRQIAIECDAQRALWIENNS